MAFGSVILTGTVETPDGNPIPFAVVNALLSANITDGVTEIIASPISAIADKHGDFSLTVLPNDYPSVTPTGTFYEIIITSFGQTLADFNVIVAHADAPTVDLFSLTPVNARNLPALAYGDAFGAAAAVEATLTPFIDNGFNPTVVNDEEGLMISLPAPQWALDSEGRAYWLNGGSVPSGYTAAALGPDLVLYPIGEPA